MTWGARAIWVAFNVTQGDEINMSDIQVGLCEKRLYQIPLINHLYPSLPLVGVSHISWQAYIFACVCVCDCDVPQVSF